MYVYCVYSVMYVYCVYSVMYVYCVYSVMYVYCVYSVMYVYCVYSVMPKSPNQLLNGLKGAETIIVLIVFNGVLGQLRM
jgi:hypothetical protein